MTLRDWSIIDYKGLSRFVSSSAGQEIQLDVNRTDLLSSLHGRVQLLEAIYKSLRRCRVRYTIEPFNDQRATQKIRGTEDMLGRNREGTCLDLATLFAGICLRFELLPVVIVTQWHALVAVSITQDIRDWDSISRPESNLFDQDVLKEIAPLRQLVAGDGYKAIECTGFAYSGAALQGNDPTMPETVGRYQAGYDHSVEPDCKEEDLTGTMSFERAVEAGEEQLRLQNRPLLFAIDVATAHHTWNFTPWCELDVFRLFKDADATLTKQIPVRKFQTLIRERTRRFVGREHVLSWVRERIDDPEFPSGYLVIHGDPGVGKSALIAELVNRYAWLHHFNIATEGVQTAQQFQSNIRAQLVLRYNLPVSSVPPDASLSGMLELAKQNSPNEPVVILIDALDEASDEGLSADANRHFLPADLPPDVFVVATTRNEDDIRLGVNSIEEWYITENDADSQHDLPKYIDEFIDDHSPKMLDRIDAWSDDKIDRAGFVELLAGASRGNFMYLVHVLEDIRAGRINAENLSSIKDLPKGLHEYYKRHWRVMSDQNRDEFDALYEPVLCSLAVAQEPVSIPKLVEWTTRFTSEKIPVRRVGRVIKEWLQFLKEYDDDPMPRYQIYHKSFQDFLGNEVKLRIYESNIVDSITNKIRGFDSA